MKMRQEDRRDLFATDARRGETVYDTAPRIEKQGLPAGLYERRGVLAAAIRRFEQFARRGNRRPRSKENNSHAV
jgi:hypothetical protein